MYTNTMDVNLLAQKANEKLKLGKPDEAAELYASIVKQEPNKAVHHANLGRSLLKQGKLAPAERCFEQALSLNKESHIALYGLAQVNVAKKNWDIAIEKYIALIELRPSFLSDVYHALADVWKKKKAWKEIVDFFDEAIGENPDEPSLYFILGDAVDALGDKESSQLNYSKAVLICKEKIDANVDIVGNYRILQKAQAALCDFNGQIESLRRLIEISQNQPAYIYFILAELLARRGDIDDALDCCVASLQVGNDPFKTHCKAVDILIGCKQFEAAVSYMEENLSHEFASAHGVSKKLLMLTLGQNYLKANQASNAGRCFRSVIEQYPDDYEGYEGMANVCSFLLQPEQEKEFWRSCFDKCPEHPQRFLNDLPAGVEQASLQLSNSHDPHSKEGDQNHSNENFERSEEKAVICPELSNLEFVDFCFARLLYRLPSRQVAEKLSQQLKNGKSRIDFLLGLLNSHELKSKQKVGLDLLESHTNEEFVSVISALILKRKPNEKIQNNLLAVLEKGNLRSLVLKNLLNNNQERITEETERIVSGNRASTYHIVGQSKPRYVEDWYKEFAETMSSRLELYSSSLMASRKSSLNWLFPEHDGPVVSIITSMYDGDEYIENFMANICGQSIFKNDCELIIINANSPGNEKQCVQRFISENRNIIYIECDERISIYDAWNLAVQKSRGLFLTNANLDDVKRFDCLEIQAKFLAENPSVDVAYSDYAYTLEPNLPFELSSLTGHCTELPVANFSNLLVFNSPHCAPMWRKSIHDELGLFDATLHSAGDMELWLRASSRGYEFGKIEQVLISYYLNPKGLSTDESGVGQEEGRRIIDFYQEVYAQKQSKKSEPVEIIEEIELSESKSISLRIPDNNSRVLHSHVGDSSYFAFSMYKSGSTLLTRILSLALDRGELPSPRLNLSQQFFDAGIDARDWINNPNLNKVVLPGYYQIGFREYAPFLEENPLFHRSKKVLLIRDPRDVLVSLYFSVLKSHKISDGEFGKAQQDFRESMQSIEIDEFVKSQSDWLVDLYRSYADSEGVNKNLRLYKYEEVVFSKIAWIEDMTEYLGIALADEDKSFILEKVDVLPKKENANQHIRNVTPGDYRRKLSIETTAFLNKKFDCILKRYKYS